MDFMDAVITLALVVLICLTSLAGAGLINIIKNIKENTKLKKTEGLNTAFDMAENVVKVVTEAVVGRLEQVSARELRKKVKSGLADKELLCALADEAFDEIMQTVAPSTIETLSEGISDIENHIRNEIETRVGLLKSKSK